jgi:hypothetical protein
VSAAVVLSLVASFSVAPAVRAEIAPSWMRRLPDRVADVTHDAAGRIYVVGTRMDTGELFVRSYGIGGNLRWTRRWRPAPGGGIRHPAAQGLSIDVARDGSIYVGGQVHAPSECGEGGNWLVARLGPRGRMLWHRVGAGWRDCRSTSGAVWAIAATDALVVAAMTDDGCCENPYSEGSLLGFSPDGRLRWTNPFEAPGVPTPRYDRVNDLTIGALGRAYAVGWANRGSDDTVAVVTKLAPDGSSVWTRTFGGGRTYGVATSVSARGRWLVVGAEIGRPLAMRLSFGGDVLHRWSWSPRRGGWPTVSLGPGGSFYVVTGAAHRVWIRKLRVAGRELWSAALAPSVGRYIEAGGEASRGGITLAGSEEDARRDGRVWRIDR